jgi:hypothetical protein
MALKFILLVHAWVTYQVALLIKTSTIFYDDFTINFVDKELLKFAIKTHIKTEIFHIYN